MVSEKKLRRAVGLPGAVMMGMGSIVGTGVFVSLGLAAGLNGSGMIFALLLAGMLAVCNGLSTAQLAADTPLSGGTYEYAYKYINSWTGFIAGWMFVCAKSASAATAAIGFGGYLIKLFETDIIEAWHAGLLASLAIILIASLGMKRTSTTNIVIVSITLAALGLYIMATLSHLKAENFVPLFQNYANDKKIGPAFFEATALMFVAYTGYGRVATLGEEIQDPVRNIPKAIITTLLLSFLIYMLVAIVSIGAVGAERFFSATINETAPLQVIAQSLENPLIVTVLAIGAITAMLGVLLNLVLGISRVVFAMGRRRDLPAKLASVDSKHHAPVFAILTSGVVIVSLVLLKDIKTTWSFSAFTVLLYYALTNLSALRLPPEKRLYPRPLAWFGLIGCLSLCVWVEKQALFLGMCILAAGIAWRLVFRRYQLQKVQP